MDATTTLADTLLDDLDDLSDVGVNEEDHEDDSGGMEMNDGRADGICGPLGIIHSPSLDSNGVVIKNDFNNIDSSNQDQQCSSSSIGMDNGNKNKSKVSDILHPRFLKDVAFQRHLETIRNLAKPSTKKMYKKSSATSNSSDHDVEHKLIVQSNKHLSNLWNELIRVHGILCTMYRLKFPELEELVPNPIQYEKAVRVIWNEMDMTRVADHLSDILSSNQVITISVAGSTTAGRPLNHNELQNVDTICTYMEEISEILTELEQFVESHMEGLAPSVCALIGPGTAAKLIGLAGGLQELSKIPSCNIQVLGQTKQNSASRAGLSSIRVKPHHGILMECDLIRSCPQSFQTKALKIVASKLALAARNDFVNVDTGRQRSATYGMQLRAEVQQKFMKLQEPDKAQVLKALPKPDLTVKKRRGGKRMRRLKESYEETSMMKQANTRAFSAQAGEYGDDAMGLTLGLLDTAEITAGGALRKNTGEKKKIKYANTRESRKRSAQQLSHQHQQNSKKALASSGLASSMVFTPVQGMELINPDANKERIKEANRMWFHENAGFQSAKTKK